MGDRMKELDRYLFHQGTATRAYEFMGVHSTHDGYVFRVWSPNADDVFLVGGFNSWTDSLRMTRISPEGIYEISVSKDEYPDLGEGSLYKYKIINGDRVCFKADPYGYFCEVPPGTASVIKDIDGFEWHDKNWLNARRNNFGDGNFENRPMNIYELHALSWKRKGNGDYLSYTELAEELAPYVLEMGYTHIELMPITEHPFDGSWGYQVTGYYAPTARMGEPRDFMNFVDIMHGAGIGVILDWVPAHFPKDAHGLYEFDGQPLYEYQGEDKQEHRTWGTRRFDLGRNEVESFLMSNARFWADKYHIDGLRIDAVSSILYLDFDKRPGEWLPNSEGDNRCLEGIAFLKRLNSQMREDFPDVMMIAEESSAWEGITSKDENGLGFSFKWNMGWMNDILSYLENDYFARKYLHDKTTFGMMYAFKENYILPISHDEVVHGKRSLLDKCPGDYWRKFASDRAFLCYMMTHPGKKLLFMGCEIAQFTEWAYQSQVEWFLLDYEMHARFKRFVSDLNHLYLTSPELWECDDSWNGFEWINADDRERSIISYRRKAKNGDELIVIINNTPATYMDFEQKVPFAGEYAEVFNSDSVKYGGSGKENTCLLKSKKVTNADGEYIGESLTMTIPPLGGVVLRCTRRVTRRRKKVKSE